MEVAGGRGFGLSSVLGQERAVSLLSRALDRDHLAGSYLFEGPSGVGKRTTAMALAASALGVDDKGWRRIEQGLHPDVRVFEPRSEGRRNIPVETLRTEILPFTQYAPFEAQRAFLIFPQADVSFPEHPSESANALLKTLEEPRPAVHFLLLSERPDRLLPTIRSRCQSVRFGRLDRSHLRTLIAEQAVPEEGIEAAIALADGRVDRALQLARPEGQAGLEAAIRLDRAARGTQRAGARGGSGARVTAAEEVARGDVPLAEVLDALMAYYRDIMAAGLGAADGELCFPTYGARARERAEELSPQRAAACAALLTQTHIALERSANPQIALDTLLCELSAEMSR